MSGPTSIVSFHAHPDDEVLLTGGTLACLAAQGHRVVLVVATAGEAGLTGPDGPELGRRRREELLNSTRALGIARVEVLGYADSGSGPVPRIASQTSIGNGARAVGGGVRFADADPDEAAASLACILCDEDAEVLTSYDVTGGYGHPDHRQVHRVGRRAAQLAGTPLVLEATLDRTTIMRILYVLRLLSHVLPMPQLPQDGEVFTARADLTHRVDVRDHLDAKRAALRAHASQAAGGPRTLGLLLALPRPVARRVLGFEWFREVGRPPPRRLAGDVLDTLTTCASSSTETGTRT